MEQNWRLSLTRAAMICAAAITAPGAATQAVPVFYLSTQNTGSTGPGLLYLTVGPNSTDTLHIWADTDVRLAGVSIDLVETGGAIKFTGLDVYNEGLAARPWAFLDGPQQVTDSAVNHIGGAALPEFGTGIGPGSPAGSRVLLASVTYLALDTPGATSELSLRVGTNTIADVNGAAPQVRFGTNSATLIGGAMAGASGAVGSITVVPEPATSSILLAGVAVASPRLGRPRYRRLK